MLKAPTVSGGQLERRLWLDIFDTPPAAYRDIDRWIVKPMINLFTLAVGVECPLVEMMISAGPGHQWLKVHHAFLQAPAEEIIPLPRILLLMTEIGLEGIAAWLNPAALIGPLPSIVTRIATSPNDTVEAQLLELTNSHRRTPQPRSLRHRSICYLSHAHDISSEMSHNRPLTIRVERD